jgi:hypothetical protein
MVACLGQRVDAVRVLDAGNNRPSSANNDYTDREELPELSPEEATEFLEGLIEAAFATVEPRYAPLEAWMTGARTSTEFFRHREDIGQSQNGGALRLPYCAKGPVPGFRTWPVPDDDTLKNEQFLRLSDYEQLLKQPERW